MSNWSFEANLGYYLSFIVNTIKKKNEKRYEVWLGMYIIQKLMLYFGDILVI